MDGIYKTQLPNDNRTEVLKEYYARYLIKVRGLSQASVKHYYDALNNISKRLREKGLVKQDVYEIMDLSYLKSVQDILYADPEFVELNERGRRMYSAGFNNYFRFASGEGLIDSKDKVTEFDMPLTPEEPMVVEQVVWKRSSILRTHALVLAGYQCEIDNSHNSFVAESTGKPYMEGHHAIPMKYQKDFHHSLDVYANIVCLCPLCHRKIHYGMQPERVKMMHQIYESRAKRLSKSGIDLSRDDFTGLLCAVNG